MDVPAVERKELTVARLAAAQQGMVTTEQLIAAGFSYAAIARRVADGWLVRRHRGVHQLGVFGGPWGTEMAALLACGSGSAVSHRSCAAVDGLFPRDENAPVDVTTTARGRPGVRVHRGRLGAGDVVVRHGLTLTTPVRTLLDLASSVPDRELERLVEEAQVRRLITPEQLLAALEPGRRGTKRLRAIVEPELGCTRSEAERRLRALVNAAGLPAPRTNVRIAGLEVDAVWPQQRLVVEVDGYAFHRTREAFERDRRRDARLLVAGYRVLRITWRRLTREPEQVIALVAAALRG
jgi:very-short-patch-repair endonuclease